MKVLTSKETRNLKYKLIEIIVGNKKYYIAHYAIKNKETIRVQTENQYLNDYVGKQFYSVQDAINSYKSTPMKLAISKALEGQKNDCFVYFMTKTMQDNLDRKNLKHYLKDMGNHILIGGLCEKGLEHVKYFCNKSKLQIVSLGKEHRIDFNQ